MDNNDSLLKAFQSAWDPFDTRPIYTWANTNVLLGNAYSIPGPFDVARSKFLIEPFNALKDHSIRQVNVMASPRCCKTLLGEIYLLYTIANNAGTFLWLQSSDEVMDRMSDLRILPLLKSCKPVSEMMSTTNRFSITKRKVWFPHMTLNLTSAKIRSLQSIGYKFEVLDECWLYDAGYIGEARARTGDFQSNSKMLLLSQGGIEGDDWSKEFQDAPIWDWGFVCANCKKEQVLSFNSKREDSTYGGIIWDKNDTTNKDGVWNYQEAAKTARLECINPNCKHQYPDQPQVRRYLNDNGLYINTKKDGNPKRISYRWNALANIEIPFSDLVVEYLQAKDALSLEGNKLRLQEFYQKRLAKSFNTSIQSALSTIAIEDYNPLDNWGDITLMSIDCQNSFTEFYYVVRSWMKTGESRLRAFGKVSTWSELREIQQKFQIRDQCVLVDSGYNATIVYQKACEHSHIGVVGGKKQTLSWIATKGVDAIDFPHPDGTRRIYSEIAQGDPALGTGPKGKTAPLVKFSNYSYKQLLIALRDGKGQKWSCPEFDEEYTRQLNSEILQRTIDKKSGKEKWIFIQKTGVANHLFDCEVLQIVGASIVGYVGQLSVTRKAG